MKTFFKVLVLSFGLFAMGISTSFAQTTTQKMLAKSRSIAAPQLKLEVSPNPCTSTLQVSYNVANTSKSGVIEIYQQGMGVVISVPVSGWGQLSLNLANIPRGMHYIRLVTAKGSQGMRFMKN